MDPTSQQISASPAVPSITANSVLPQSAQYLTFMMAGRVRDRLPALRLWRGGHVGSLIIVQFEYAVLELVPSGHASWVSLKEPEFRGASS